MATIANLRSAESNHWYSRDGRAQHTVMGKTRGKPRPTTIKDARVNGWLPSTTNILRVLHKEGLERWKQEQIILTCLTAPRLTVEGVLESDDQYVERVFRLEEQHKQEGKKAADLGTTIHRALEGHLRGESVEKDLWKYIEKAVKALDQLGKAKVTEKTLVGDGYAGTMDALFEHGEGDHTLLTVLDAKSTKTIPDKRSWPEHCLQTSSYAAALGNVGTARIQTANLYISTTNIGEYALFVQADWTETYTKGFKPVLDYWFWANKYWPTKL